MRSTIVPAQITTVEDKIMGNLGVMQLALLIVSLIGGCALYVILPPFYGYATYKVVVVAILAALCGIAAVRIKGQIILRWAIILLRYNVRPRYFVFDKNSAYLRKDEIAHTTSVIEKQVPKKRERKKLPHLSIPELSQVQDLIRDPRANVRYTTNAKGEISVHITEIK